MTLDTVKPYSLLHKVLFYGEKDYFDESTIYQGFQSMNVGKHGLRKVKQYHIEKFFKEKERLEKMILDDIQIIICTCAGTYEKRMAERSF